MLWKEEKKQELTNRKKEETMGKVFGIGETCTIQRIGGSEETRRFLANLGFVQGAEVTVLSAIGGNVIVNIKDSRVAINKDMARHIMV